jgi:hypothetical protein
MHKTSLRSILLVCAATLALAACGGNDDQHAEGMAEDPGQVPASATVSATAFSAYVAGLPTSESTEPLTLAGLVVPLSETEEPIAVR